ncbi:MAG: hypothetical protein ABI852_17390 [Gemmatimonadaceae bacterium]
MTNSSTANARFSSATKVATRGVPFSGVWAVSDCRKRGYVEQLPARS